MVPPRSNHQETIFNIDDILPLVKELVRDCLLTSPL